MSSLLQITRRLWTTPLDRMTYHGAGCCNLPVEIWKEIFTLACASKVAPALLDYELVTPVSTSFFSTCQGPNILSEFLGLQKPALYAMRYTIVLVCKAWYYMGVSMLHAHIRVHLGWSPEKLERLYESIRDNQSLSCSVVRLSIIGGRAYSEDRSMIARTARKNKTFKKISNMLPNLHIITIPYRLARGNYPLFRPDIAFIYDENSTEPRLMYDPLTYGTQWWHHCTTLSLAFPNEPYRPVGKEKPSLAPVFPNLITLMLSVRKTTSIQWITSEWVLPVLRNLSIASSVPHRWTRFIEKFNDSLESLEIVLDNSSSEIDYYPEYGCPPFIMHRLKDLYLSLLILHKEPDPLLAWVNHIKAPNLQRLSFHFRHFSFTVMSTNFLRDTMASVLQAYPTVKELGACYHAGKGDNIESHSKYIRAWEDIENWCKHCATVEVTRFHGREKLVYSQRNTKEWSWRACVM